MNLSTWSHLKSLEKMVFPMAEKAIMAVFLAVSGSLQHPDDLLRASKGQPALEQEIWVLDSDSLSLQAMLWIRGGSLWK